jgi:hypothetical protein
MQVGMGEPIDQPAASALPAGLRGLALAQKPSGEPEGQALLPDPAWAGEQHHLREPVAGDRLAQSASSIFMADQGQQRHGNKLAGGSKKASGPNVTPYCVII